MRDNKERKTNIILISLSILCLIICLLIIVFNRGVEEKNVVLVKDLQDGESRIISDKTDSLSNTGGTFVYKAEEPEGLLNPDDVFKETNNIIMDDIKHEQSVEKVLNELKGSYTIIKSDEIPKYHHKKSILIIYYN